MSKILRLRSCRKSICKLEKFVVTLATRYKIEEERYPDILISLTEAVNNAIEHGNNGDLDKFVKIEYDKTPRGLSFSITDEGDGFNPSSIPDPTHQDRIECCGGRGLFLMRELSDHLQYHDNGRRVEIHFHI